MSKRYFLIVILLILVAIGCSLYLIPRSQELALMQMKDKYFEEARLSYEQAIAEGHVSLETASKLADLYLQTGQVDKAIEVMEKFIATQPDNLEARQYTGTLYQYAQRPDDYLKNLQEINRLKPSPENLKTLADIYNYNSEYDKQIDTLRRLIEQEHGTDAKPYSDLATILAAKHQYGEAIQVLQELKTKHPESYSFREVELLVNLLLDDNRPADAYGVADDWRAQSQHTDEVARLVNILHFHGHPELAEKLLAPYSQEQISQDMPLLQERILLQLENVEQDQAYAALKQLYDQNRLTPDLSERLLFLSLAKGDRELTGHLMETVDFKALSEPQLVSLVELALAQNYTPLLAKINSIYHQPDTEASYPILAATLALANHDKIAGQKLAVLSGKDLTKQQSLLLARVCSRFGRYDCTRDFLAKLPNDSLTDSEIANMADLYLQTGDIPKGERLLAAIAEHESPELIPIRLKYAAARGDFTTVENWLTGNGETANLSLLTDLYFSAVNHQQTLLAARIAETLYARDPRDQTRAYLSQATMRAGHYEQAVALLREVKVRSQGDEANYLMALTKLAPRSATYRKELGNYATARLRCNVPEKEKMALIYALINAHQAELAMPQLHALALKQGGQWAYLYANLLDKQGRHEEARDFWVKLALQPGTSPKERRNIAYALLNHGYREDAERLLVTLSDRASAISDVTRQLLYIWGPRLSNEHVAWLKDRYLASQGAEKGQWGEYLGDYASGESLAGLVADHPESLNESKIAQAYFTYVASTGSLEEIYDDIDTLSAEQHNPNILETYAQVAAANGQRRPARMAYDQLFARDATNTPALRQAGILAFNGADYNASKLYLDEYMLTNQQDVTADAEDGRALFLYAELLRRDGRTEQATVYYNQAFARLSEEGLSTPETISMASQSMVWLGRVDDGLAQFRSALALYPADDNLRADYASTLIDLKRYDEARTELATPPAASNDITPTLISLPIDQAHINGYQLLSNTTQLVLNFDRPLKDADAISPESLTQYPWLAYSTQGYDRMLLAAKPGYHFQVSGQGKGAQIAVATDTASPSYEALRQVILRYELLATRIDLETGHVYAAAKRVNAILPEYANDAQALGMTANAENYGGNWPQALTLLAKARAIDPENEDLAMLDTSIRRITSPNVKLDHEWVRRGKNNEQITTLSGYANATDNLQIGAVVQNDHAKLKNNGTTNERRDDGRLGTSAGNRQRGELYGLYHWDTGQFVKASLFGNNDTAGIGAYFHFLNLLGETTIAAEFRRPYWEFTAGVLDDATRDRLAISHTIKPDNRWSIMLTPGVNRYRTDDVTKVANTASLDATVAYQLQESRMAERPYLAIVYTLNGEYSLSQKRLFDASGNPYRPFPFRTREIHALAINALYEFNPTTYAEGLLGWEVDRLGGNGPLAEAKITHELTDHIDAQLRAAYGIDTQESGANTSHVGGYMRYRF